MRLVVCASMKQHSPLKTTPTLPPCPGRPRSADFLQAALQAALQAEGKLQRGIWGGAAQAQVGPDKQQQPGLRKSLLPRIVLASATAVPHCPPAACPTAYTFRLWPAISGVPLCLSSLAGKEGQDTSLHGVVSVIPFLEGDDASE